MKLLKTLPFLASLILLLSACGGGDEDPNAIPADLAAKKEFVKNKKMEVRELEKLIAQAESEVEELEPAKEKKRTTVTTVAVQKGDFKTFVELQGAVQADETVNASSEVGGRITQMNVQEGQNVTKGQLIAVIDLEQIDKQEAELQKSLELAVEVFNRQKRLWDQNIGSEIQYLQAKNSKERLEKSLETLNFQKTKANVYAPISGVAEMVFLEAGELAGPGAPIVQILNTRKVKVVVDLPETYLTKVKRGQSVEVNFPAINQSQATRISMIGRQIDPANRTFPVEIALSNRSGLLKPNLLAEMKVNDSTIKDAITIPMELVQQEVSGRSFVYIQADSPEGTVAKKVYVETGMNGDGRIVIEKGLTGDETLIDEGARSIADNQLIQAG
ncbi:MAG: efflux RND transporter periplasmic adaptor subunit [Saprospiraceae bacterium]